VSGISTRETDLTALLVDQSPGAGYAIFERSILCAFYNQEGCGSLKTTMNLKFVDSSAPFYWGFDAVFLRNRELVCSNRERASARCYSPATREYCVRCV
jgi:hypothetical protein